MCRRGIKVLHQIAKQYYSKSKQGCAHVQYNGHTEYDSTSLIIQTDIDGIHRMFNSSSLVNSTMLKNMIPLQFSWWTRILHSQFFPIWKNPDADVLDTCDIGIVDQETANYQIIQMHIPAFVQKAGILFQLLHNASKWQTHRARNRVVATVTWVQASVYLR